MQTRRDGPKTLADSTRNRIIDAALEAFATRGFKGATTKEIARRARVNEVTLFRLFKSKKALFAAAIQERSPLAEIEGRVVFDVKKPIEDVLFETIKTVLALLRNNKHLYMLMLGESWRQTGSRNSPVTLPLDAALNHISDLLQAQMDSGILATSDPKVWAMALIGSIQFYFMHTDVMVNVKVSGSEDDRTIRRLVALFLNGMGVKEGGS